MTSNSGTGTFSLTTAPSQRSEEVIDTMLLVETPEKISFQYQLAGPFRRIIAYGLDVLFSIVGFFLMVLLAYLLLLMMAFLTSFVVSSSFFSELFVIMGAFGSAIVWVLFFVVQWFYGAIMETYYNGQTLGKMVMGFRVISKDGHAIDGVQALLRNFFRLLDVFPMYYLLPTGTVGLVAMMATPKFQRLGDLVAGTIVVVDEKKWVPELAKFSDPRVAQLAEILPEDFVPTRSMLKALAEYVDRRRFLSPSTTYEIAVQLAPKMLEKFGLPANTDHDLLLCAMYFKAFLQFNEAESHSSTGAIGAGSGTKAIGVMT